MMALQTTKISRTTALGILGGLLVLLLYGLMVPSPQQRKIGNDEGDVALFSAVVQRVRQGEPYYSAMGSELRPRGYPTASPFNWRMPFPLTAVAAAPRVTAVCFFALGILAIAGTLQMLLNDRPEAMLLAILSQIGVVVSLLKVPQYMLMAEAWAGFLILASLVAYHKGWRQTGAVAGVLALFARELAAPYCLACGVISIVHRRQREFIVWAAGAVLFAMFLSLHIYQVGAHTGVNEAAHRESWIQFGGLPFALRVISFVGWYDVLPVWTRAVGCMLLVATVWAPRASVQLRAAAIAYLAFFSVVGLPFNHYWGLLTAPAFAAATGYGLAGLLALTKAATRRAEVIGRQRQSAGT